MENRLAIGLAIVVVSLAAYWPTIHGGFIMDDNLFVANSPLVRAPDGLYRIWFTSQAVDYWPVTNSSFWIEWRLWGNNPAGYHITNLLLHIACSLLLWRTLEQLGIPGAWLAALLFAVHPVNVATVGWISQRKNLLAMLFSLPAIIAYMRFDARQRSWLYWLSLALFALAMLSKGAVATLPLILLLIIWWQRGKISQLDLLRAVPFLLLAALLTVVNIWFQTHGSAAPIREATFAQRLLGAGAVIWFYLYKALLPIKLSFIYPPWTIDAHDWRWWMPLAATVAVTALLLWKRNSSFGRPILFAWLLFCIGLLPVMGFVDVGFMRFSLVGDHYLYFSLVAVTALVAAGVHYLHRFGAAASIAAGCCVAAPLVLLTAGQSRLYSDPIALYTDAIRVNPRSYPLRDNLAEALRKQGRMREARDELQIALSIEPRNAKAQNDYANFMALERRWDEAIHHYWLSLQYNPASIEAHRNLGYALEATDRLQEAALQYETAASLARQAGDLQLAAEISEQLRRCRGRIAGQRP